MRGGVALFVFRRDFRTTDNPAWERCSAWCRSEGARVAPIFIFSDLQTDPSRNPYFSGPAFAALRRYLDLLAGEISAWGRLSLFRVRGGAGDCSLLEALRSAVPVRAVFFNRDVTPFARERDSAIAEWCARAGVHCGWGAPGEGYLLWPAGSALTRAGTVPRTFSAFRRAAGRLLEPPRPRGGRAPEGVALSAPAREFEASGVPRPSEAERAMAAGLPDARAVLAAIRGGAFDSYGATRDDYRLPTTRLSAALKFGAVSPWAAMRAARARAVAELERQLLWREFYFHLAHGYPGVLGGLTSHGQARHNAHIRPDRERVRWARDGRARAALQRWAAGATGEPLVDGAMRELRRTGYLHNRLRMVVASFLCKELRVDWREGERELARLLLDYDPCQNSGGWQAMDAQMDSQRILARAQVRRFGNPFAGSGAPRAGATAADADAEQRTG